MRGWQCLFLLTIERSQFSLSLIDPSARLQATDNFELMKAVWVLPRIVLADRHPDVCVRRQRQFFRQNSSDRIRAAVQRQCEPRNCEIRSEAVFPQTMTNQNGRRNSGLVFFSSKVAPHN